MNQDQRHEACCRAAAKHDGYDPDFRDASTGRPLWRRYDRLVDAILGAVWIDIDAPRDNRVVRPRKVC